MIKNAIAPIQAWLLSQGRCVACGRPLAKGKSKSKKDGNTQVVCTCGRIFIKGKKTSQYRRALQTEVE